MISYNCKKKNRNYLKKFLAAFQIKTNKTVFILFKLLINYQHNVNNNIHKHINAI